MKLLKLTINNFRGLTFDHDFTDEHFVVLTGVNGSGKSTIIESLNILLTKQATQIDEQLANQSTDSMMSIELVVQAEAGEINYLAQKIHEGQPNQASVEAIEKALNEKIFIESIFKRRFEIEKPVLGWKPGGRYVREYLNDKSTLDPDSSFDEIISPSAFSILSREIVLKFEQLDGLNLSFSNTRNAKFSIQNIFQPSSENPGQRIARSTVNASPLLDSLITYGKIDNRELLSLVDDFNEILDPVKMSVGIPINGFSSLVLDRGNGNTYTVESASSGQKKAIVLATLKYIWNKSAFKPIVLLDEPENSMHPGLTSRVFESLSELTSGKNEPSFVVATHSPEVVAANAKNTFRILTKDGRSTLKKVSGLDDRAEAILELGVHFHLDYVAQKIVFVESEETGSKGGISDAEAYQLLVDPNKEGCLFVSTGSKNRTQKTHAFQKDLFDKLQVSSSDITFELTDRDDDTYDPKKNTPFKNIEYLYISNQKLLAECIGDITGNNVNEDDITNLIPTDYQLIDVDAKKVWASIIGKYKLNKAMIQTVQRRVLIRMRNHPELQDGPIKVLISRFES